MKMKNNVAFNKPQEQNFIKHSGNYFQRTALVVLKNSLFLGFAWFATSWKKCFPLSEVICNAKFLYDLSER